MTAAHPGPPYGDEVLRTLGWALLFWACVLLGLYCTGCAPVDHCHTPDIAGAYAEAEAAWVANIGELPADCLSTPVETRIVSAGDFTLCSHDGPGTVLGCAQWSPLRWAYQVEILECRPRDETYDTLTHERAHTLQHCVFGASDAGHTDERVWGPVAPKRGACE